MPADGGATVNRFSLPVLDTDRLQLRLGAEQDIPEIIGYFKRNELHLSRSRPTPAADFLTSRYWQKQIALNLEEFQNDKSVRFFAFDRSDGEIIGAVNFSAIMRGPAQFCYLGYGISANREGQGLMFEAAQEAICYMFEQANLHRVMANYMPTNTRSGNLLKRLGFVEEGFAKNYLFLNGRWCDHVMTSLSNPDWRES